MARSSEQLSRIWASEEQAAADLRAAAERPVNIINLTPHVVRVRSEEGGYVEYPPSGTVARVTMTHAPACAMVGANAPPVFVASYGAIDGLPSTTDEYLRRDDGEVGEYIGPYYIVSSIVAAAKPRWRNDLLVPATGHPDCERRDGQVYAVPGFIRP